MIKKYVGLIMTMFVALVVSGCGQRVEVEKANAEAEVNRILANSMTPAYVQYRQLNALDALAASENKVFVPFKMLDSVSSQVQLGRQ